MTIPEKLVAAAAEALERDHSEIPPENTIRVIIAAVFAALPECEEVQPWGYAPRPVAYGWEQALAFLARMAEDS